MRKSLKKKGLACLLAAALSLSPLAGGTAVWARDYVNTQAPCSLTVALADVPKPWLDAMGQYEKEDLAYRAEVTVDLYRIGDITEVGTYTALPGYEGLGLENVSSETSAAEWLEKGKKAAELLDAEGTEEVKAGTQTIVPRADTVMNPDGTTTNPPSTTFTGLVTGIYLVVPQPMRTLEYDYIFVPYLVSLPNNDYYSTGSDAWIYDVTVGVKPEQELRYGDIVIEKELDSYNSSLGDAVFVFQVEAVRNGEKVYSNVLSLNFSEPGMLRTVAEHIPSNAEVTVTEVYSGAGYTLSGGEGSYTVRVIPEGDEGAPNRVYFENDYSEPDYGTGVTNHYEDTGGGWSPAQAEDNRREG